MILPALALAMNGHPIGNAEACINSLFASFLERGSVTGLDRSCAATIPARPFQLPGSPK